MGIETSIIVVAIVGIAEALKIMGLPAKIVPLINIIIGVTAMLIWGAGTAQENALIGLIAGLTAGGLFSGGKSLAQMITSKN